MNDITQVSQANLENKVKEEAERYLNIYRPTHGHLVLDDQYMKQIKASLEYGLLTRILSDIESVDVDYLNQLVEGLCESLSASTEFKLKELSNAISTINNQLSSLNIQAIRDSIAAELYVRLKGDDIALNLRLKALEDALGKLSHTSNNNTRDLRSELISITDGINSRVSAIEQTIVNKTADDILLASKVSQLEAIYEDNNKRLLARIREESEVRINGYEALTQQITNMVSQVNNSTSTIEEVKRTYSNLEQSSSERISTLESSFRANDKDIKAKLQEQTRTFTDANKALTGKVTNLETNIDGKIGAKFNETIETITSKEEALARRISELNTSFLGLDGKLEGTVREEIKSVSDANKVHLSKLEELEGKTDTTLGKIESLKETIVTPEQVTNIVSDEMAAKYSNAKDKILDTRDTNELPRYYYTKYPNALAKEVKLSAVMGIDGEGELGYLETQTIGTNYKEGKVTQIFYSEDGDTYKRVSITEDIWNVWKLQETDESAKEKLRLALLEIQQKIVESEARIEDYNKTHSDATKALAESIKQLEADYKEGDRIVNSRILTMEQVESTVDTASAENLKQLTSALDEVKGSIRTLQNTVTNPDGTLAVSEEMIRSLIIDETKIKETKDVNSTPEWYVNNHLGKSTKELKTSTVIDLTQTGDAYLETNVLSASVSRGSVKQEVFAEDGRIYTRQSTGLRAWSDWVESESSVAASARLLRTKEDLEKELAKVYSEFTDYKATKTSEDEAEALRIQGLSTKLNSDYGTLLGKIETEERSRLTEDASINKRIDTISSNLGANYATIKSVNDTKVTLENSIAKKGEEITTGFNSKLTEERDITNLAIKTSADDVTEALVSKINEYKDVASNAKSTIDDYKRTNDDAVKALGERQTAIRGEYTQDIVDAKVAMQGVIDTTKDGLIDDIDKTKKGLEKTIGEVSIVANKAKSDIEIYEKTLNNATESIAETKKDMKSRFETTETTIKNAKEDAVRLAKEDAIDLIDGVKTELKKYTDAGISNSQETQAKHNEAFAREDKALRASISTLPTTTDVEAKVSAERVARVNETEALVKQITKGSAKFPNGTGNVNEVSTTLNDIIKATADSSFVDKSSTFKATVHREVDEKLFRDAGNLLTDTINYNTWDSLKHPSETFAPRLVNGVWELNGTTAKWKELGVFSKEGSKLDATKAQESLVQVSEGSEYILEFEAKGNTSLETFITMYYKEGTISGFKQILSVVTLNSTWTKHKVQIKCPELGANEVRDYIGVFFRSNSIGNTEIRKPRLYLDPSALNAAIKEYKKMSLDMQGNLDAKIGLTVDSMNRVTGWYATDKNKSSEFNIMADSFKITNSSNTRTPFSIDANGNIRFNGNVSFSNVTNAPSIPTQNDVNTWTKNQIDNLAVGGRNYIKDSAKGIVVKDPTRYIKYDTELGTITQPFVFSAYVKDVVGNKGNRLSVILTNPNHNNNLEQIIEAQIINNRIVVKFDTPRYPTNTSILVYANSGTWDGSATGSVTYYKAKMEFGSTVTDWTPAPEDVEGAINSAITAEQKARADADIALGQRMTVIDTTYKTANSQTNAKIATLEQSITTANQAFAQTQQTLTAKIDGLSVGGRNLLKHTEYLDRLWRFAEGGQGSSMVITNGVVRLTGNGTSWKHFGYDINKTTAEAWLKDGKTFTLSVYAKKISGNPRLSVIMRKGITSGFKDDLVGKSFDLSNDWQKLVVTGTMTAEDLQYLFVLFEFWGVGSIELKKPKLEYGNIATDWSPALEDMGSRQELNAVTDLNTLTTQGQYFIKAGNNLNAPAINWLFVDVETTSNQGIVVQTVRQDDNIKNQWVRQRYNGNWTAWEKVATGSELDAKTQVTLQKISQVKATADGLSAEHTVKIDNGGRVSGYGLASGAGGISEFSVVADRFYIAPPNGGKGVVPFTVQTTPTIVNGVSVPAGTYIASAFISNGSITNAHIANGTITNAKIGNAAIKNANIEDGAITTAKIGNAQISNAHIADAAITTAKIGTAQVDTLQIAGEAVVIPRLQHSEFQEFYDIDTEVEVNRVSLNAQGGAVSISFGFDGLEFRARNIKSNDGIVNMRIKRGNTVLRHRTFPIAFGTTETFNQGGSNTTRPRAGYSIFGQTMILTFLDVPPSGEQVYTVTLESRRLNDGLRAGDWAAHPVKIHGRSLHIMGVKR